MQMLSYSTRGGPEVLCYHEAPDPVPSRGQVLVRNESIAIEGGDLLNRVMFPPRTPHHVVGYSSAGEIIALGEGVEDFTVGEKVAVFGEAGSHASLRVARADQIWTVPDGLDMASAACAPVAFGTAHEALFEYGQLKVGQTVLIQGAAGGVSLAAVQLANKAGARVIGTGSSDEQLSKLRQYGLDDGINHRRENVMERVMALTDGKGVDVALDPIGGSMLQQVVMSTKDEGRIVLVGGAGREHSVLDAVHLVLGNRTMSGFMLSKSMHTPRVHDKIADLLRRLASRDLVAVIDRTFRLSEGRAAHEYAERRGRIGRVIMVP